MRPKKSATLCSRLTPECCEMRVLVQGGSVCSLTMRNQHRYGRLIRSFPARSPSRVRPLASLPRAPFTRLRPAVAGLRRCGPNGARLERIINYERLGSMEPSGSRATIGTLQRAKWKGGRWGQHNCRRIAKASCSHGPVGRPLCPPLAIRPGRATGPWLQLSPRQLGRSMNAVRLAVG